CRYQNFFNTFFLDYFPLGITAVQERQFIKAYFSRFLCKPFSTIHIFSGSHGNMQPPVPPFFLRNRFRYLHLATFTACSTDYSLVKTTFSISQHYLIAYGKTQNP